MKTGVGDTVPHPDPVILERVFGNQASQAVRYVELLATEAIQRGLLGPREVPILWERHIFNSAAVTELFEPQERVIDIGSGAGLPGIPVALAAPQVRMVLLEPLQRRTVWLEHVIAELGLAERVHVKQARAEHLTNSSYSTALARAVAPLVKLLPLALPLLAPGGQLLALKGRQASAELATAQSRLGDFEADIVTAGELLREPTTVVRIGEKTEGRRGSAPKAG